MVAFYADYTKPIGPESLRLTEPWVQSVPQEEMFKVYEGCGPQVMALLKCIKTPSKWSIHVVQPHLESFVKGRVVVIGDAVSMHACGSRGRLGADAIHRHMECCHTLDLAQVKVSKTDIF